MNENKMFAIPGKLLEGIAMNLQERPWREVNPLMVAIQQVDELDTYELVKDKPEPKPKKKMGRPKKKPEETKPKEVPKEEA